MTDSVSDFTSIKYQIGEGTNIPLYTWNKLLRN